jgi:hypothetical protein
MGVLRGRTRIVVVLACLALLVAGGWWTFAELTRPERVEGHHLEMPHMHGYQMTLPVGQRFTDGGETLDVVGDRPVVLESVELVDGDGLRVLGFMTAGPERNGTFDYLPSYPPVDPLGNLTGEMMKPGPGTELAPGVAGGWELLLGLQVMDEGPLWREAIRINYTVDGEKFFTVFPAQISLCTEIGQKGREGRCT